MIETDEKYMRRCLQLAANGRMQARPNPMVGAVIVYDGRIIGEGYHVKCGEAHAEVNAFASVAPEDERFLSRSTVYVSLEPCAHYGKTPPCADLIVSKGVRRCVVGCVDSFSKVSGRGIRKLEEAGIEVTVGVLEEECREINKCFFTFNTLHRPYITLKWAQSADGFMDADFRPCAFSTTFTRMLVHRMRAESDAILVGRVTDMREHPQLNVRYWHGRDPKRIVLGGGKSLGNLMAELYADGVQSLMVEGGAATLNSFISAGLWDEARVETAPFIVGNGTKAPDLPSGGKVVCSQECDGNVIMLMRNIREI